jgi:valyl-tRNA synthetase
LSNQWFVRMKPLSEPALEAYKTGRLKFVPERWGKVYEHWMTNIRDWNISRQLWWGHRIPAWFCENQECDHITVAMETPESCGKCGGSVRQDDDVLDTWFSSWLWPFATFGWPKATSDLQRFYPGHTLVTAPDIIFFWVARMVMAGYHFMGDTPFETVYLNGVVRDPQHRAFSKSLGNGIDRQGLRRVRTSSWTGTTWRQHSPQVDTMPTSAGTSGDSSSPIWMGRQRP